MTTKGHVLVIDDDARVLRTFSRNLRLAGYEVLTASRGAAGLQLFEEAHPDVVLVDVRMPDMDGFEVLHAIRERDAEAEVILVTGHGDMDTAIEALRAGASDFIPKPVEQKTLHSVLHRAQERQRLNRELREAREALQASESRFRQLLELAPDAIFLVNPEGRITLANSQVEALFGHDREAILGQPVEALVPIDARDMHREDCITYFESPKVRPMGVGLALFGQRQNGSAFPVDVSLSPIATTEGLMVMAIVRDITERRRIEERLRLQGAALESAANAIAITDYEGTITWVNPAFTELTGYTFEEAVGRNPRVLKSGMQSDDFYQKLWKTIRAGEVWHGELVNQCKDGTRYDEEMTIAPVRDPRGEVSHFIAIKQDVTARKEAEEALRQARDELEVRVQQRTRELKESYQHQRTINTLLRISGEEITLEAQLGRALDEILSVPWLPILAQGAIFLTNEEHQYLEMVVQRGLSADIAALCSQVPAGRCLCGEAFATRETVFAAEIDARHEIFSPDMQPHGHYCVPILSGETLVGVLVLYLRPGHEYSAREVEFLQSVAHTLASLIERKRAETARLQSQQRYQSLVNSIDGIVWEADPQTLRFIFVSAQAEQILGYPPEAWYEMDFLAEHIVAEDRQENLLFCRRATAAMQDHELEYRMIAADGRHVWMRAIITVMAREGVPHRLRGVMINITARKQLETRLAGIHRLGRELTLLHDEDTIIQRALQTAAQVLDFRIVGCGLVDEAPREIVLNYYLEEGVLRTGHWRLPLDQTQTGIAAAVVRGGHPLNVPDVTQDPRYIAFLDDAVIRSELCVPMKAGEQVIGILNLESIHPHAFGPDEEQLLQTLADQIAVAIQNARLYTRVQRNARELAALNTAMHAMASNLDLDTVLRQTMVEVGALLEAEDASVLLYDEGANELIFAAVAAGSSAETLLEQRIPADAGIAGWAVQHREALLVDDAQRDPRFYQAIDGVTGMTTRSLLAVPLIVKGEVIGVIEVINKGQGAFTHHDLEILEALSSSAGIAIENARLYHDLQEQMRIQQKTQAQLIHSEKMTALGRLVASLAHEINNPLQSIQGCLTLADEEMDYEMRPEKLRRYLDVAEGEIERIATIVRRVRDFHRPAPQEQRPTDLHAALESVLELTRKQLQHNDVTVTRAWSENVPEIMANVDHLKQVFLNLILNAVDAMPEGGALRIHTWVEGAWVHLAFEDTGVGMPPDVVEQLFEPFFTTKPQGSGLGLSISYGIIESHEGRILVKSQPGVGTTFTLMLPVVTSQREA